MFTPKLIQSSKHAQSCPGEPKVQKDYKAEYKKMKAKLALLEASPPTSQSSKPFQSKSKGLEASPSSENVSGPVNVSDPESFTSSVPTEVKTNYQESKIIEITKLVQMLMDEKINSTQKTQELKPVSSQPELSKSVNSSKQRHNRVIHVRGGVLAASSQSSESSIEVNCTTCGSNLHSTTDYNDFKHFKRCEKLQATKAREPTKSGFSRSTIDVKSYLHKYVEQPVAKVVFGDNSSCITEGHGSINCGGIIFSKQRTIFNANKEIVLISPRRNDVYVIDMSSLTPNGACFFVKASERWLKTKMMLKLNKLELIIGLSLETMNLRVFVMRKEFLKTSLLYTTEQNGVAERKNRALIEAARTMLNGSVLSKHFWTEAFMIACYTQNRSIIVKIHDRTPYEIFRERISDISYFHVFGCPVFIHNHKVHLGKFDAKADDQYFLGYSINSKAFRVYNTRRHQIEESYHVIFDESMEAIRWSRDQHIEFVNIIGDPGEGMLTRSMATKLTTASTSECLFADFLSEIEPKKTLVPLPYGKIAIGSKWVFSDKIDEHGIVTKKKAILVVRGYSQEEGIDYHETFAAMARMEAIRIFLPPGFESSEFPEYVYKLDKALYGLKQAPSMTPLVPPNNLGPDLAGNPVNETMYRGMIGSLMYLTITRIFMYLKGTSSFGLWYSKCLRFDIKGYSDSDYAGCNLDRKNTFGVYQILRGKLVCWSAKKQQSVAMFSTEAEHVVAAGCCAHILCMKSQLNDSDIHCKMVPIFCDNTSAISISYNPVLYLRTNHIDIRYHFIRDHILKGDIELYFSPTEYQLADIFAKPLDEPTFTRLKA
ncbi:retrovirus-related pol polyprotein from transposon TNT 1-94 [Tanacetum coccineum]|uniref:Retrovirus-related pol polyprotein from transposon TNT 1-94 n=1 Tax=Tanacetum coccineum TaxID=301880 RepID=A0ABQ5A2F6_9ASTR